MDVFRNRGTRKDFMSYLKQVQGPCRDFEFYLMVEKLWPKLHGIPSQESVDLVVDQYFKHGNKGNPLAIQSFTIIIPCTQIAVIREQGWLHVGCGHCGSKPSSTLATTLLCIHRLDQGCQTHLRLRAGTDQMLLSGGRTNKTP